MSARRPVLASAALLVLPFLSAGAAAASPGGPAAAGPLAPAATAAAVPAGVRFDPNVGQAEAGTGFVAHGAGTTMWVDGTGVRLAAPAQPAPSPAARPGSTAQGRPQVSGLRVRFTGADAAAPGAPVGQQVSTSNYLSGPASGWRTGVPSYAAVRFRGVYPGVDVQYRSDDAGGLEFDVVVAPGADPSAVRLSFDGARSVRTDASGTLVVEDAAGQDLRLHAPVAYQDAPLVPARQSPTTPLLSAGGQARSAVSARFEVSQGGAALRVGAYDRTRTLVVDPAVDYATPFPGDVTTGAVAPDGSVYVVGSAVDAGVPATSIGTGGGPRGADVAVTKVDRAGGRLDWVTYVGGSSYDSAQAAALATDGSLLLAGSTSSRDLPLVHPASSTPSGSFLAALDPRGDRLDASTYLVGSDESYALSVAGGPGGRASVLLSTTERRLPLVGPSARPAAGRRDAYVTTVALGAGAVAWAGYVGGTADDSPFSLAAAPDGTVYVTGATASTDFPTLHPVQATRRGDEDAFLAVLDPTGRLTAATYLGGGDYDTGDAVTATADGVVVSGTTASADFPVRAAAQRRLAGSFDAFVTRFSSSGQRLDWSTFLGGPAFDQAAQVVSTGSTVYVTGEAGDGFPVVDPLGDATGPVFLTALSTAGAVQRSVLVGDSSAVPSLLGLDEIGQVYVGGSGGPGGQVRPLPYGGPSFLERLQLLPSGVRSCAGLRATVVGTDGPDTLVGTPGDDVIAAGGGDDVVDGRGGDDVVCGGAGDDHLTGGPGRDVLLGGAGDDVLDGSDGDDVLDGGAGADRLTAGQGTDALSGGPGADVLVGGTGRDSLDGGDGDDVLRAGPGTDVMTGGTGTDDCTGTGTASASGCEHQDCLLCWDREPQPVTARQSELLAVAAGRGSEVWAVGAVLGDDGQEHALVERYDGARWAVDPAVAPAAASQLVAVTTTPSGDVWAVGTTYDRAGTTAPLVAHRTGGAWSTLTPPVPGGGLSGVSVGPDGRVWVSGQSTTGGLVARWDGRSWTVLPAPPADVASDVVAVGSDEAWAAGPRYLGDTEGSVSLHWQGGQWRAQRIGPAPDGYVAHYVNDVAVLPGRGVRVLGSTGDFRGGYQQGFLVAPGGSWQASGLAGTDPLAVDADAAARLFVVGSTATGPYEDPGPQHLAAAFAAEDGLFRYDLDTYGEQAALFGVEMTDPSGGWAVGAYRDSSGSTHALLLRHAWSGR